MREEPAAHEHLVLAEIPTIDTEEGQESVGL